MMSARQAASLALIAFGLSELFLRRGGTAKSIKTTATDQGTTLLILGSYGAVIAMLCLRSLLGAALPSTCRRATHASRHFGGGGGKARPAGRVEQHRLPGPLGHGADVGVGQDQRRHERDRQRSGVGGRKFPGRRGRHLV